MEFKTFSQLEAENAKLKEEVERLKDEVIGKPKPFDLKDTDWGDTPEKQVVIWQEIAQERQEVIYDLQSQLDNLQKSFLDVEDNLENTVKELDKANEEIEYIRESSRFHC